MRSQFNQTGSSPYHVILGNVVVHDPITINVPANHGTLIQTGRGVVAGDVNITWFASQLNNIITNTSYIDPTHLPIFVTDNVMLYIGPNPLNCCVIGFHGASKVPGNGGGSINSNGNAKVQTYAWGSYVTPGSSTRTPTGRCRTSTLLATRSGVGGRPVHQQHRPAVADADCAAVRLHRHPQDRRPGRGHRILHGHQQLQAGSDPDRNAGR